MDEDNVLEKTNRINLLIDFYELLLTEKQRTFLKYYFHENYSLGEIAATSDISRQAVYEHIKRAEHMLEEYEAKLQLLVKHEARMNLTLQAVQALKQMQGTQKEHLKSILEQLLHME